MATQIELLKKYGLSIRGNLGQHLLIDPNIQRKTVDLLELEASDQVLEIGPGLGALTAHLLERCRAVTAIEMDAGFVRILKEEYPAFSEKSHRLVHGDILKTDLSKLFKIGTKKKVKVISNLPYYITAPIMFHLLETQTLFSKAVFTMQKEVASRLTASPGSKDYGRLTLGMRYAGTVKHAFDIPPSCFAPPPAVSSSVVTLDFYPSENLLKPADQKFLFHLIHIAFSQRRKMFLRLLAQDPGLKTDRQKLEAVFQQIGIAPTVRGEELLLKDYLSLAVLLKKK